VEFEPTIPAFERTKTVQTARPLWSAAFLIISCKLSNNTVSQILFS
jgi:hypothetical protein